MKSNYRYKIYGLVVDSEIEIPQAMVCYEGGNSDVRITLGTVPTHLSDSVAKGFNSWIKGFDEAWFNSYDAAQYYVSGGNTIIVMPYSNPNWDLVVSMLLSAGLSLIILQRNEIVLHGSVVSDGEKAFVISGESGAGKSTLTMKLLEDEKTFFMADDTVRVTEEDGEIYVHPTYPQQKVCRDLAERIGLDVSKLKYIDEGRDKFALPRKEKYIDKTMRLDSIYIVKKSSHSKTIEHNKLQGMEYIYALISSLYLSVNYTRDVGVPIELMKEINRLYSKVGVYTITRPNEGDTVDEMVKTIKMLQLC